MENYQVRLFILLKFCIAIVYIQAAVHCCLIMLILLNMPVIII